MSMNLDAVENQDRYVEESPEGYRTYQIKVTHTERTVVPIEARSKADAIARIAEMWDDGMIAFYKGNVNYEISEGGE